MLNHPDRGGDEETMKAINNEYDAVFPAFRLSYNKTAATPTKETAESTRSEFYTQNGWKGSRYDSSRSLKEIAEAVRQFIKEQFPTYKFSVRTKYASMCQELIVEMKEAPCKVYKDYSELTEQDKALVHFRLGLNSLCFQLCVIDFVDRFLILDNSVPSGRGLVNLHLFAPADSIKNGIISLSCHE